MAIGAPRMQVCRRTTALVVALACSGLVLAAAERADARVETFKPIKKTKHALVFSPRSVRDADAVRRARVVLRKHGEGRIAVRRIAVKRVRRTISGRGRIRVRRARGVRGRLKLKLSPRPKPPPGDGTLPTSWTRFASFESDLNSGTDHGWRIDSPFSVSRTAEVGASDGASAAKIVTNGGNSSCSCPRMTFDGFSYDAGREFWIGGSWRVPEPGKLTWSRLMNIGHFESSDDPDNWYVGLVVRSWGMQVVARRYHTEAGASVLMPPRAIPQNRWFDVDLHLKLSPTDGQALTEVYLDGTLIATSTARNMLSGGPLHFFNAGLPHFWDGNGDARVFFDAPRLQD